MRPYPRSVDEHTAEVEELCDRFRLDFVGWMKRGEGSRYVARVRDADGRDCVLKAAFGRRRFGEGEPDALLAWNDTGVTPRLLAELDPGVLLLEYVEGETLSRTEGRGAARAEDAGRLARALHIPAPEGTPALETWAAWRWRKYAYKNRALDPEFRILAYDALEGLLETAEQERLLLHGDLQPVNIIVRGGSLVAIDPLGVTGCAAADLVRFAAFSPGGDRALTTMRVVRGYGDWPDGLAEAFTFVISTHLGYCLRHDRDPGDAPDLLERIADDGSADSLLEERMDLLAGA